MSRDELRQKLRQEIKSLLEILPYGELSDKHLEEILRANVDLSGAMAKRVAQMVSRILEARKALAEG